MEVLPTIYYDANTNLFKDDDGIEYGIPENIMSFDMVMLYEKVGGTYHVKDFEYDEEYDIYFPTPINLNKSIAYDSNDNTLTDEDGNIMYNIFSLITPNVLFLFKKNKEFMCVEGLQGGLIDLVY